MKISVIVPVYNKEKYLNTTLRMICNQSFNDFECLLIDDGSTDNSGDICDLFVDKDARFKVFHIKNQGVSHARNVGLDNAKGDYITFVDSDDELHPEYLKNLFHCIENHKVDMVISGIQKFWDISEKREDLNFSDMCGCWRIDDLLPSFAEDQQRYGIYGWCVAKLIPKNKIGNIRFNENLVLAEDLDFYMSLYPKIETLFIDNHTYYYYRQEADNSSINSNDDSIDYISQLELQIKIYSYLNNACSNNESNKDLCLQRIDNYVYFSIYHATQENIDIILQELIQKEIPDTGLHSFRFQRKQFILFLFYSKRYSQIKRYKKIYDSIRGMKKKVLISNNND